MMGKSVKYGLAAAGGFIAMAALMVGILWGIDSLYGMHEFHFTAPVYMWLCTGGLIAAFCGGFAYPLLLREDTALGRLRLLSRYGIAGAAVCFITAGALFSFWDENPGCPVILFSLGFALLILTLALQGKIRELRRHRFHHY